MTGGSAQMGRTFAFDFTKDDCPEWSWFDVPGFPGAKDCERASHAVGGDFRRLLVNPHPPLAARGSTWYSAEAQG